METNVKLYYAVLKDGRVVTNLNGYEVVEFAANNECIRIGEM